MSTQSSEDTGNARLSAPITGFVDYDPQQQYLFNVWLKKTAAIYERFGFTPLHLRPFERLGALQGEGDTQKQIFELFRADTGQTTKLGLPFDHTVPLALWVAEMAGHFHHLSFPYKRYDLGLSYRGERPKMGRFRAFVQADIDIIGKKINLSADVECIAAITEALSSLSIGPFLVKLNHIGIVKSILNERNIPEVHQAAVLRAVDKLDKLSTQEVASEMGRIEGLALSVSAIESLLACFTAQTSLFDPALDRAYGKGAATALSELREVFALLKEVGMDMGLFTFCPGMVRGLSYYTGVVVETFLVGKEQYGSVASGGRYSHLVGSFADNLQDIEGVGLSIGLTRLFDILCKTDLVLPKRTTVAQVLVGARTEELASRAYALGSELRRRGFNVDIYSGIPKVKQILAHANTLGVPHTTLVMDEGAFVVKDMQAQTQVEFATDLEVAAYLGSLFNR